MLVVVGILIAVNIDNWNDERKSDKKGKQYVIRLIAEAKQDIVTFSEQIEFLKIGMASVGTFASALNDPTKSDSALIAAAQHYNQYGSIAPVFSTSRSTFDDLSNTGNLEEQCHDFST